MGQWGAVWALVKGAGTALLWEFWFCFVWFSGSTVQGMLLAVAIRLEQGSQLGDYCKAEDLGT